jgi:protein TonB
MLCRHLAAGLGSLSILALTVWGLILGLALHPGLAPHEVTARLVPVPPQVTRILLAPDAAPLRPPPVSMPALPSVQIEMPRSSPPVAGTPVRNETAPLANEKIGSPISAPPDYLSRLLAYLNDYKRYPLSARLHHERGIVRLHFIVDRGGHVLSYEVVGSSGFADLDEAARTMIRNAQPLPPVPPEYPGPVLDLVLPLVFSLH